MEEPIVIEVFKKIFKPLIKLMGYLLCFPQLLLKKPKLSIIGEYHCNNILQIIYTLFFLCFYNLIYLNFHLIYFLRNFSLVESKFELFISFIVFYSFTATFYYSEDIRFFILKDLGFFLILLNSVFQYLIVVLSFFVRLDSESFNLIFANNYNIGIHFYQNYGIINFIKYPWETACIVILNVLIILHLINPLSLFRIPTLIKCRIYNQNPSSIIASFFLIILDFVFLALHLLNSPFIFSFIKNTLKIISSVFSSANNGNWGFPTKYAFAQNSTFRDFFQSSEFKKYNYCVCLILDSFVDNYGFIFEFINKYIKPIVFAGKVLKYVKLVLKYLLVFVFSAVNLVFFWRIKQLLRNQRKFKLESNLVYFIAESVQLNFSAITDLLFLIAFALNWIIVTNYFFLGFYAKNIAEFTQNNLAEIINVNFDDNKSKVENEKIKETEKQILSELSNVESFKIFKLLRTEKFLDVFTNDKFYAIKILNFQVLFTNTFDLIFTLISIINMFSPTFYIKLYNYLKYKKNFSKSLTEKKEKTVNPVANNFLNNFYLFPLLSTEFNEKLKAKFEKDFVKESFNEIWKIKNTSFIENYIVSVNLPLIRLARKILFQNISRDLYFGILLVLNIFTIVDPFSGLMHFFNVFKFLGRIKMSFSKFNEINFSENKFSNNNYNNNDNEKDLVYYKISAIIQDEITVATKVFYESILNIFVRVPLILVSIVLFPFNFFKAVLFCVENYYVYFYKKTKQNNQLSFRMSLNSDQKAFADYNKFLKESAEEINNLINLKKNGFIKSVFTQFIKGWATLLKFVLIHLSVIRGVYLYYDLFTLKKFYNFFQKFIAKINKTEEYIAYVNFMNKENDNKSIYEEETNNSNNNNINNLENANSFVTNNYSEIKLLRLLNSSKRYFSKKNLFIFYDNQSWLLHCNNYFLINNNKNNNNNNNEATSIHTQKSKLNEIEIASLKKAIIEKATFSAYCEGIIEDNFNQLFKEILFYPFVFLAFTLNPIVFYLGFLAIKSNDYNIFRQRKFALKFKICISICLEFFKIMLNILKIILLLATLRKISDLLTILYYYSRTLFSKNPDCYFKCLLDEHYEGEFSKDLNTLVLQTLKFYFVSFLVLLNFVLLLRVPSVCRRVSRFIIAYVNKFKFKYFGKKLKTMGKASPLEATKINCFASICEFLKPKELGKIMVLNKTINKRIEKKLIWENLFVNFYLRKINKFLQFLEFKQVKTQIEDLEYSIVNNFVIYEGDEEQQKHEKQSNLGEAQDEKAALEKKIDTKQFEILSKKFEAKNFPAENLKLIQSEYFSKTFEAKVLCQKAQNSFDENLEVPEKLRDKFLGLTNVVIEETFESIFKSPHLILLPFKLLSLPVIIIANVHASFYFKTFGRANAAELRRSDQRHYEEIIAGNIFYNIQLYGLWSLLKILLIQLVIVLTILDKIYRFILRAFSLNWLLKTRITFEYDYEGSLVVKRYFTSAENQGEIYDYVEVENLSAKQALSLAVGHAVTLLVLTVHFLILVSPTIFFKREAFANIYHKAFLDEHRLENHSITRAGGSPLFSALNWWVFCEEVFNAVWQMSLASKFYLVVGNYFLNFTSLFATLSIFFNYWVEFRSEKEVYPYYQVIVVWMEFAMKYIFSFDFLYNIIYPHIFLFKVYKFFAGKVKILNNKVLLNLVSFVVILFPFYFNFKVKFSLFRFITINTWAVTSFMKLSRSS